MNPIKDIKEFIKYPKAAKYFFVSASLIWASIFTFFIYTLKNQTRAQWINFIIFAVVAWVYLQYLKYCTNNRLVEQGHIVKW